ncbi:hypothetical protein AWB79_02174 [Caballeronia hypogeia]|uniref:Uncharacterized protein n=1 Tax=Caballeronia hypogeia TaxID=1777140 RepID=A0A158AC66_9BURK|nr:hypothetical protein AWB79_02174 [Caballeronia hypogeia]
MLTPEGADEREVIVRPCGLHVWHVEIRGMAGIAVRVAQNECEAVMLARDLCPGAQVRVLPAVESAETLHDGLFAENRTT